MRPAADLADAVDALRAAVASRAPSIHDLTASGAWGAVVEFASVPMDLPDTADADGVLHQFGTFRFTGEPLFHLSPLRQLARSGCDEYVQVGLDLRFAVSSELDALGRHSQWWFGGDAVPLADWAKAVADRSEWAVLDGIRPLAAEIVCTLT